MTRARRVGLRRAGIRSGRSKPEGERQKVWRKVKAKVFARAADRCEVDLSFDELAESAAVIRFDRWVLWGIKHGLTRYRCRERAIDAHHVVRRSQGRDDRLQNLLGVCRGCHNWFDEAPQSARGKLMSEPSASPDVAPRTWVTRESKWERRSR